MAAISGRDGIKLLCDMFGIDYKKMTGITVTANINDYVRIEARCIGQISVTTESIELTTSDNDNLRRYEVTVRKINSTDD
jgi:hypothetical protein